MIYKELYIGFVIDQLDNQSYKGSRESLWCVMGLYLTNQKSKKDNFCYKMSAKLKSLRETENIISMLFTTYTSCLCMECGPCKKWQCKKRILKLVNGL